MKTARIFWKTEKSTNRDMMVLAGGERGRGNILYSCYFLPEQFESEAKAMQNCKYAAKEKGVERLFIEREEPYPDAEYAFEDGWYFEVED